MESVLVRYRNLIILVGVLFLQVLGLAVQVKRAGAGDRENARLIRIWAVGAITPFERGVVAIQTGGSNLWHNYFYLRGVRSENRELKEKIEQMRIEQVRLSEDAAQARRLQTLLAFKEQFISKTVAAQVIGSSGSDLSRIIYIDKGADAGIKRDMAVITADGIVGKVMLVYPSVSQILLINDQTSGVGVILEKSRLQGVLRGTVNGEVTLERVMSDEEVPVGESVLTSGGDQIFPKGLPVGMVAKVTTGKDLFWNIKVKPSTDLSKLEEVLVLVEKQERQPVADNAVHVRAADILAQRLPSVPEKPPADANASTEAASGAANTSSSPGAGTKPLGSATGAPTRTSPAVAAIRPAVQGAGQAAGATPGGTVTKPSVGGSNPAATAAKPATAGTNPATGANAAKTAMKPSVSGPAAGTTPAGVTLTPSGTRTPPQVAKNAASTTGAVAPTAGKPAAKAPDTGSPAPKRAPAAPAGTTPAATKPTGTGPGATSQPQASPGDASKPAAPSKTAAGSKPAALLGKPPDLPSLATKSLAQPAMPSHPSAQSPAQTSPPNPQSKPQPPADRSSPQ